MSYKEEFVEELEDYGLTKGVINRVLDVLRIVYISQGNLCNTTYDSSPKASNKIIGYSNGIGSILLAAKEIQMLYSLKIIDTRPDDIDCIYKCTKRGDKIGHELVEDHIERNKNELVNFLDEYPNKFIGYALCCRSTKENCYQRRSTREKTEIPRGYLVCQDPKSSPLSKNPTDKLAEKVKEFCEGLSIFNLTELCKCSVSDFGHYYDTFYYIFPPEIINFIIGYNEEVKLERELYTIRAILYKYSRYTKRSEFVKVLSEKGVSEAKIQTIIDEAHGYGLTSKYNMKDDKTPFFILNDDEFRKFLGNKIPNPIIPNPIIDRR